MLVLVKMMKNHYNSPTLRKLLSSAINAKRQTKCRERINTKHEIQSKQIAKHIKQTKSIKSGSAGWRAGALHTLGRVSLSFRLLLANPNALIKDFLYT